jgi:hypothetical protein
MQVLLSLQIHSKLFRGGSRISDVPVHDPLEIIKGGNLTHLPPDQAHRFPSGQSAGVLLGTVVVGVETGLVVVGPTGQYFWHSSKELNSPPGTALHCRIGVPTIVVALLVPSVEYTRVQV